MSSMALRCRSLLSRANQSLSSITARTLSSRPDRPPLSRDPAAPSTLKLLVRRFLHVSGLVPRPNDCRYFTTNGPNSPKEWFQSFIEEDQTETIRIGGRDFVRLIVELGMPDQEIHPTHEELVHCYIKTLAMVLGSVEEAEKRIYSASTESLYAFEALVPKKLCWKIEEMPWVLGIKPLHHKKHLPYLPVIVDNGRIVGEYENRDYILKWIKREGRRPLLGGPKSLPPGYEDEANQKDNCLG